MSRLQVVQVRAWLDPQRRSPAELMRAWRDFARPAAAAAAAGAAVTIISASWSDAVEIVDGITVHFVREDRQPSRVRPLVPRLAGRVAEASPDLIHFEGLILPLHARTLARRFRRIPLLAQDHGSHVPRGWRRVPYRWGFAPLAGVIFTARAQAEAFKRAGVLRRDLPVHEVVEGSTSFAPGDRQAARAGTGISGDPALLWVGHLDRNKDPLTVLAAAARAAERLPGLALWMCFRGADLLPDVQARIAADARLQGRVHLLGEIAHQQMEAHYRSADFLIQASHKEGSGYGVIEALACGTTPLLTDIPSFRAITASGRFGALVPTDDPVALGEAIVGWAGRDREELRRAARAHFESSLSFDAIGRQLVAAYRSATAGRSS